MGPGAPQKLGAPVLFEILALYSYMTLEMQKSQKTEKSIFQIELTANEFLVQK